MTLKRLLVGLLIALAQTEDVPITLENAAQVVKLGEVRIGGDYPHNIVNDVAFSPDGETFALGRDIRVMEMRDVASLEFNAAYRAEAFDETGMSVAFSPDGSILAAGEINGSVRLWDTASGGQIGLIEGGTGAMFDVAFTPDGATLVAADGAYVWLWDVATRENRARLGGAEDFVTGVAVSPNGQHLAATSWDGIVRVWGIESGEVLYRLDHGQSQGAYGIAYSPDGSLLATGGDGTIFLWDTASGTARATFTLDLRPDGYPAIVWDLDFNPDATLVAAAVDENGPSSVLLWDVQAGREVVRLAGHQDTVLSVDFSPDGTRLASTSADGTLRMWGIRSSPVTCSVTAPDDANRRSGPGTNFEPAGLMAAGQSAIAVGQAEGADGMTWYQLRDGNWVRSDVVNASDGCGELAVVTP